MLKVSRHFYKAISIKSNIIIFQWPNTQQFHTIILIFKSFYLEILKRSKQKDPIYKVIIINNVVLNIDPIRVIRKNIDLNTSKFRQKIITRYDRI
jgi:hypothetical protein